MIMRFLVICIFYCVTFQCVGQNDKAKLINKIESSSECLSLSSYALAARYFNEDNIDSTDYYLNMSISCDKVTLCRFVLAEKQAIVQGIEPPSNRFLEYAKMSFPEIVSSCSQSDIDKWKENQKTGKIKSNNSIDSVLLKTIERIKYEDQKIRNDDFYSKNLIEAKRIDSLHLQELDSIIQVYGRYPGRSLVGADCQHVAAIVIHHNSIKAEKYLEVLKNAVISHELSYDWYQIVLKRYLLVKYQLNQNQIEKFMYSDVIISGLEDDIKSIYLEMRPYLNINPN